MTTAITYTISGARTLDQLNAPTDDGQPDENARENCVPASIAEGLNILVAGGAQKFVPDELKDAVYGQGYVGVQSAHAYVAYCAAHGVKLVAVDGTQAQLVATVHREVSAGHPVLVTMPSQWGTAPADPVHPSGYTHVGLAVGIGPNGARIMNPWPGFWQDEDDGWWAARFCFGQVWVMQKATTTGGATMATSGVPAGWRDDGKTLTAPNGITVGTGIRDKVLSWPGGWPAWNVPIEEEHHLESLELFNPSLGAGTQQMFVATVLEWTPTHGTIMMAVGKELQATRAALAKVTGELTMAQQQASQAQAEAGDELARGAAHAFVQAFTAAVAAAVGSPPAAATASAASAAGSEVTSR